MSNREHWPRWVFASITKHFVDHFDAAAKVSFVEGDKRNTALEKKFYEVRMDGPRSRQLSKGYWELFVPVNILIQTTMTNDTHLHRKQIGVAFSGFADTISILKLGNGPDDDGSFLTCFSLEGNKADPVKINDFGQVDTTVRLQQATVEGHYIGNITE